MARDLNIITVHGTVGKDPVIRQVGDSKVASFSLAVRDIVKGEEKTTWLDISSFQSQDFIEKYLRKGARVVVSGRLTVNKYTSTTTGAEGTSVGILANHVEITYLKKAEGEQNPYANNKPEGYQAPTTKTESKTVVEDDLPF